MFRNRFLVVSIVCFVLALFPIGAILAAPTAQGAPIDLPSLLTQFMSLAGVGAFVALLVNILKYLSVVKDGDSMTWVAGFNLVGLVLLFILKVFVPSADIGNLDGLAAVIAQIGVLVLGLITQLLGSKLGHVATRGAQAIGFSYTLANGK